MDIIKVINKLGYLNIKCICYNNPKLLFEVGHRPINIDVDVVKFIEDMNRFEFREIYVDHNLDNPII